MTTILASAVLHLVAAAAEAPQGADWLHQPEFNPAVEPFRLKARLQELNLSNLRRSVQIRRRSYLIAEGTFAVSAGFFGLIGFTALAAGFASGKSSGALLRMAGGIV